MGVRVVWMRASGVCASPPNPTVPARSVLSYHLLLLQSTESDADVEARSAMFQGGR